MSASPYIFEVTESDFDTLVVQNSQHVPVLVDFWAAWCGPCKMLLPILEKLADDYGGQFLVAKINSDEQQGLARRFGVRSIPTLKLFRHGEVVEEAMGVQPEQALREMIDRHIEKESDRKHQAAVKAWQAGDLDTALQTLQQLLDEEPANARFAVDLASLQAEMGQLEQALTTLRGLPSSARDKEAVRTLMARLELDHAVKSAPSADELEARLRENPADSEARYLLAQQHLANGEFEAALDGLLSLLQREPGFRDGAARQAMLDAFQMIEDPDLVQRYRRRMFAALH
jgi:putative thioredoxin